MAERVAVFVSDELPKQARDVLSGFEIFEKKASDADLARCRALVCWPHGINGELVRKMTGLTMIQTMSAGVDKLPFADIPKDVQVFSNAGAFTEAVAEHAWGLLLGVAKGAHVRNARTVPRKLRRKTLLVVGAGAIGSEVARLSKSVAMKTMGVSRSFKSPEVFDERYPVSRLADVFPRADAVVMALPLTKATAGLVGYDLLSKAKDAVIVVNVGRAESISEDGLMRWLKERPESRFATDVFWMKDGRESYSGPAWELPNFAGTLHISAVPLGEDLSGTKVAAAWNVRRFFETGDAVNRVDSGEYA
ncbi:MAG: 3-phosphoglycerate dehydrogenase [Nitrososphaerota archaeon]|nr:3-phosphoglycerate dehydrogenase [Nitrososphaerota archaeon]